MDPGTCMIFHTYVDQKVITIKWQTGESARYGSKTIKIIILA